MGPRDVIRGVLSGEEAEPQNAGEENENRGIDQCRMADGVVRMTATKQGVRDRGQGDAQYETDHPARKVAAEDLDIRIAGASGEAENEWQQNEASSDHDCVHG